MRPEIRESSVLFPHPDDPTIATNSPASTSSEMSNSASVSRSGVK